MRQLATRYGIVTPYTSHLIVEEGMRLAGQPVQSSTGSRRGRGGRRDFGRPPASLGSGPSTGGPVGPTAVGGGLPEKANGQRPRRALDPGLASLGKKRTGKEAIAESKAIKTASDDFYLGSKVRARSKERDGKRKDRLLQRAAGRVFVTVGKDLVEQGLPADWQKQAVAMVPFSKEYFELLKQKPQLAQILALGERVVFRDGKRIVHVKPATKKTPVKITR
ncbi:MAG TPA: hypothetical protein EYP98_11030 [Planctomycetes bacterium]|nr:hypothetical protein [Planctomycetota bacterium]